MAKNTFRQPEPTPVPPKIKPVNAKKPRRQLKLATWLNDFIGLDRLFGEDNAWPIRHIDRIWWVSLLIGVYIGLNHNAERLVRRIQRSKTQVDELRAQATVLQSAYNRSGRQSELSKRVAVLGLTDSSLTPPHKLVVRIDER